MIYRNRNKIYALLNDCHKPGLYKHKQRAWQNLTFTYQEQYFKWIMTILHLASSFKSSVIMLPRYLNLLTNFNAVLPTVKTGKLWLTIFRETDGLNTIHMVLLVLKDILVSSSRTYRVSISSCGPCQDGASRTISSAKQQINHEPFHSATDIHSCNSLNYITNIETIQVWRQYSSLTYYSQHMKVPKYLI